MLDANCLPLTFIPFPRSLHPSKSDHYVAHQHIHSCTLSSLNHSVPEWRCRRGFLPLHAQNAAVSELRIGLATVYRWRQRWRRRRRWWRRCCQVSSTICNHFSSPVYWFNIQYASLVQCVTQRCRCGQRRVCERIHRVPFCTRFPCTPLFVLFSSHPFQYHHHPYFSILSASP